MQTLNPISEAKGLIPEILKHLPGETGRRLRYRYYQKKLKDCGYGLEISDDVIIYGAQNISIGNNCIINNGTYINGMGRITIGNHCLIGMNVVILTANHNYNDIGTPIYFQKDIIKGVTIGNGVWIGANCVILPGVTIGNGCVIGAGSIVTRDIPDYSVAVGNPAKTIKNRVEII